MTIYSIPTVVGLLLAILIVTSFLCRRGARMRAMPCPTVLAGALVSPAWDRYLRTERTLDRIGLRPGQRVLEIGPGPGRLLIPAARRVLPGGEVVGLEIQQGMLERLQRRAAEAGVSNLTAVLGDATKPHFLPASFDVIYLCTALGEITAREAALRECFAALRAGGSLSITEIFPDPHYQSKRTLERLAQSEGFSIGQVYGGWWNFTANFVRPKS